MKEAGEDNQVHMVSFGKGEGFSHQASQPLAQVAVEALDVICARFGVDLGELRSGDDLGIRLPDVGEAVGFLVGIGDDFPQPKAGLFATVADGQGHHLAGAPTQRQPNPPFVFAPLHETLDLVQFEFVPFLKRL